jgi:2-octaprenyl-6-methoxyphenol hydroxylase
MFDAIIVGGGLTGGTLACALAAKGLTVALVDFLDPKLPLISDGRSFGLSRSSYNILTNLNLWPESATPIIKIHISEDVRPQHIDYSDEKEGRPLGYVVDSALLKSKVRDKILFFENIHLFAPTTVTRFERTETEALIETCEGEILKAPLCIAADGRSSDLRAWAKIPVVEWDYPQKAIVCNMAHTLPHENQAFEHFLPSGPLAFVPRPGNMSGLAWSIETDKADVLMPLSDEDFAEEVQAHFGHALGKLTLASERWSYPLSLCLPKKIIENRLALVGDAAHAFHPVSAQGLNVGLRDVAALTELLIEAFSLGLDLGSSSLLSRYQRWRRKDILSMSLLTDGLVRVFSNQSQLIARGRSFGFGLTKNVGPLKRFMTRHAMGLTGKIPTLARDLLS